MAMTRKSLKAMGLTDEQIDSIIEMHTETVDGLKDRLRTAEGKAEQLDGVQKELDDLKAKGGDFRAKYEQAKKELDDYKADVTAKETKAAKAKAAKAFFEGKNITGKNLDIAMRAAAAEIDACELDGEKIKDTKALDELVKSTLGGLVVEKFKLGAQTATPPTSNGGTGVKTREDIYKRDNKGRFLLDATERQKALSELIAAEQQKG